ncbi:serine acetyltransferase [Brevundimonas lenta]|uniref:Serine O-acetyltransferase n=1 Tax=Brevundimonas lenta TaxID=424796 RepID=A0A7W6JH77_9CAUL|nr:serine acetyltransferase [Brevundimonas lenta]MBB4084118.1 serine O-acetyltransferase [Brevundimonas lenta]
MSRIRSSLDARGLAAYAANQCNHMFPDREPVAHDDLAPVVHVALERLEHCFSHVDNKYFFDGEHVVFNHLHGDQYAMWLYLLSNELFRQGGSASTCSKLFLLNKALHGVDAFYEVELPSVFLLVHPLGTVLGRGNYSDFFVAYQRCGVGSNNDVYPTFGKHVTLRPGSAVLGACTIGEVCQIATESLVLDRDLPDHTLYIGAPKTATLKRQDKPYPLWRV